MTESMKPDYGVDAPNVLRNLYIFGTLSLALAIFAPRPYAAMFRPMAALLVVETALFTFYVKVGKMWHRDLMLSLVPWRGDEQVLDVGCGRGLLLVGAAKRITTGHVTGIDLWSNVDMGGNSAAATEKNMQIEGVTDRCTLVSMAAQDMPFADGQFQVIVSNLCIHNIYDKPTRQRALRQIARVLAPGGTALISDFKLTGEYKKAFAAAGLEVSNKRGSFISTFPPLNIVIARKSL